MTANLIAEYVKRGVPARLVAQKVSRTINVNEKTARNKINGVTAFTLPEAIEINTKDFGGEFELEYLFAQSAVTA